MQRLTAAMVAVAAVMVLAAPGVARAQEAAPKAGETRVKTIQEADRTVVRKKTVVDFSDSAIEGDLTKPEGAYVLHRKRTDFQSLIRVRDNFAPELQKSVDNL